VQGRLTFEDVAGGTDTLGQEISRTQTQGLQDVYDLNQSSSPFSPRLRMLYQLTLQELNTSFYVSFKCKMKQKSREGKFIRNTLLYGIVDSEGFIESAYLTIRVRLCQFTSGHKAAS
jgi:hypothetical protein